MNFESPKFIFLLLTPNKYLSSVQNHNMYFLNASCWICGEEYQGLTFGAGMIPKEPLVPAWEKGTTKLTSVSLGHEEQFRYYTERSMHEPTEESEYIEWGELRLCRENNYCPECEEMSLDFEVVGEGD